MAAYTFFSIEAQPGSGVYQECGPTTDYLGELRRSLTYEQISSVNIQSIPNTSGLYRSSTVEPKIIPIFFSRNLEGAVSSEDFHTNITNWFGLGKNRSGLRKARFLHLDGSTTVEIPVAVERYQRRTGHIDSYHIVMKSPVNYFQDVTETSTVTSSGSATVTNDGNARAPVILEMSGSSVSGIEYTITDNTGRGLYNYPVVLDSGITSLTISQTFVLVDGQSVPFRSTGTSGNDECWLYVTVPANGSVKVTIVYNTGATNPLADTEDMGNIKLSNQSNVTLEWGLETLDDLLSAPSDKSAMWYLRNVKFASGEPEDFSFQASDGPFRILFTLNSPASGQNANGNAMVCVLGVEADATNDLEDLSRETDSMTANEQAFVKYKTASVNDWIDAWTTSSDVSLSSDIDIDLAVQLAVGIEYLGATSPADGANLEAGGTAVKVNLHSSYRPTITSEAVSWMKIDGAITNAATGQALTFDNFLCPDGTLEIDTNYQLLERALNIPGDGYRIGLPVASDGVDLMSVDSGDNDFTETVNGNVTIKHRDAYEAAV